MDKETVEHIFRAVFTTKEMEEVPVSARYVYGIVKQHNGHITVYSEVGKGTPSRSIYRYTGEAETGVETPEKVLAFGTETVLLVDDEELVRELGARILLNTDTQRSSRRRQEGSRSLQEETFTDITGASRPYHAGDGRRRMPQGTPEDRPAGESPCCQRVFGGNVSERNDSNGAKGFVTKPFPVRELLQDVRKVLDED